MTTQEILHAKQRSLLRTVTHKVDMGSITDLLVDIIVRPASNLSLGPVGGVEKAILAAGGSLVYMDAMTQTREKAAKQPGFGYHLGDVVVTNPGVMDNIKHVIHVACHRDDNFLVDKKAIHASVKASLKAADKLHARSIAFPTMGAGVSRRGGVDAATSLRYTLDAMQQYFLTHPRSFIKETHVVVFPTGEYQNAQQLQEGVVATYKHPSRRRLFSPLALHLKQS